MNTNNQQPRGKLMSNSESDSITARNLQQGSENGGEKKIKKGSGVLMEYGCGLKQSNMNVGICFRILDDEMEKKISPTESRLLRYIHISTVGGHNLNKQDRAAWPLVLEDLAAAMNVPMNKLYVLLKSLHKKGMITRGQKLTNRSEKTHTEVLGLNPDYYGELLTERQKTKRKPSLKLVPKQDENPVSNQNQHNTESEPTQDQSSPNLVLNQYKNSPNPTETIEEKNSPGFSPGFFPGINPGLSEKVTLLQHGNLKRGPTRSFQEIEEENENHRLRVIEQVRQMRAGLL